MEWLDTAIAWLQANWGTTLFGTLSIGSVITTLVFLIKQWISNKAAGQKYDKIYRGSQKQISELKELYELEKVNSYNLEASNQMLQQAQVAVFDAIVKIALASKLDSEDKAAIVLNLEKAKTYAPKEIVQAAVDQIEKVNGAVDNMVEEVKETPEQTAFNVINTAATLLDKYANKE